jgi:hypothetical protein
MSGSVRLTAAIGEHIKWQNPRIETPAASCGRKCRCLGLKVTLGPLG